jgi:tRNA(Glu) U13 pseudouridine synthase TruD
MLRMKRVAVKKLVYFLLFLLFINIYVKSIRLLDLVQIYGNKFKITIRKFKSNSKDEILRNSFYPSMA